MLELKINRARKELNKAKRNNNAKDILFWTSRMQILWGLMINQ